MDGGRGLDGGRDADSGGRSVSGGRPRRSAGRSKVEYTQSAKIDLAAQTSTDDPRMRYSRYRTDKPLRVLGDPEESQFRNRYVANPEFLDDGYGFEDDEGWFENDRDGFSQAGRAGARQPRGTTVREYRQRQRSASKPRSNLLRRLLAVFLVILALLAVGFIAYQSPLFAIENIEVEGARHVTKSRLTELAAIPQGSTLLRVDFEGIKSRVKADTWIESVEIRRSFPSTIVIIVTERQVAAVVEMPAAGKDLPAMSWLVSKDGAWLGAYDQEDLLAAEQALAREAQRAESAQGAGGADGAGSADAGATGEVGTAGAAESGKAVENPDTGAQDSEQPGTGSLNGRKSIFEEENLSPAEVKALPHIKDVAKSVRPQVGETIDDEGILNALAIVNGVGPDLLALIQSISAPDRVKTSLTLTNNVGVEFGSAEDLKAKEKVILALLAEHGGKIIHINVRVADRATYRAAD